MNFDRASSNVIPNGSGESASRISGTSEMAASVRDFDWSKTPLGASAQWSETLCCAVNMVLAARIPMQLLWGSDMTVIYNDAMKLFMAGKHPHSLGQPCSVVWSEAWPQVKAQLEDVLLTGQPLNFRDVFLPLMSNGVLEDMYWDYSYSAVHNPDGTVAGILNVSQNTTEQNVGRQRLQASEAQARRVLRSIGDAVIVTDAEANVTRMNPVAERLTGWTETQARLVPLTEVFRIVNESTRLPVESPAAKVKRLGKVVGLANHTILITRDGSEVHIDDSGAPIRDESGELTGIVLVFRDIGDRRRVEKERDAAYKQLQLITNALPAYVSYLDRDLRYVHANRAYEEWFGIPLVDILGKTVPEVLGEENAGKVQEYLNGALAGQVQRLEYRLKVLDTERVISATYLPDFEEDGVQVRGVIVQGYDITDFKRAEEALIQSEKLAAVGRLAASIAHEINNPLESVTNLLYLARADASTDALKEYLDTADRELRRVAAITNQTLRFHKQSTRPTEITCEELVEGVISIYQGRIVNSRIRVESRKRATKPVLCFTGEIRQVINNLVGNAIDAMHPEGGRLIFRSRDGMDWKTQRRGLVITVADTGPGMTPHTLEKAFKPFFTTKGIGGTGLGLWISQEIMRRHHGEIRLRSSQRPGHSGTVFAFFLPYEAVTR